MATDPNILEVRIQNSENNTFYYLSIRRDRLDAFWAFLHQREFADAVPGMPGLSWAAMQGLDAIFDKRPRKFPVYDIIQWFLLGCAKAGITAAEIEKALEKFSTMYPPDVAESV
jgi:hypothetical protein